MNTCPTCGQEVNNGLTALAYPCRSIIVDGRGIALTHSEFIIAALLFKAMKRGPVHVDHLLNAIYNLQEPEWAEGNIKVFIFKLRRKLEGTNLTVRHFRPRQYGFVYEAREAA